MFLNNKRNQFVSLHMYHIIGILKQVNELLKKL